MRMKTFHALGDDAKPYRLSLDTTSIISVEENSKSGSGPDCILRGRKGETYLVKGDFASINSQISPKETVWSGIGRFLNTKLGTFLLTTIFITIGGAVVKQVIEGYSQLEAKREHERSLLIQFDTRVGQMAARGEQIKTFGSDGEKGSATLCIYHLAAGDGTCDSTAIEGVQKRSLASIVNELTGLGVGVDSGPPLKTLGEIETQEGETPVNIPGGVTRLYPEGLLTQKLDSLRNYSGEAWKHVGRRY
jgi:hypothetical protein